MQSSCNTTQTTVGLPLSDHIVSQVICQHPSLYARTVQGQMCCILTKYAVADQMLKLGDGHIYFSADLQRRQKNRLLQIFGGG